MPKSHSWTRAELREFIVLWETASIDDLSARFRVSRQTISAIAAKLRKAGVPIQKKKHRDVLDFMINEIAEEYKSLGKN